MSTPSRIESIFLAALGKKVAADRVAYLDHACGGDALRCQVERLLEAHSRAQDFLAQPAVDRDDFNAPCGRGHDECWSDKRLGRELVRSQSGGRRDRDARPGGTATMWETHLSLRVCSQRASGGRQPPVFLGCGRGLTPLVLHVCEPSWRESAIWA